MRAESWAAFGVRLGIAGMIGCALMIDERGWARDSPMSPNARPTKIEPITTSMAQLLDDGYAITAMSSGLAGFGFVLRRDKMWVFCTVGSSGRPPQAKPTSDCGRLN